MGRPRSERKKDWARNLYSYFSRGIEYFVYERPTDHDRVPLGTDFELANEAAKAANELLMPKPKLLDRILTTKEQQQPFDEHLDHMVDFWQNRVTEGDMSPNTLKLYLKYLRTIRPQLGSLVPQTISVGLCNDLLESIEGRRARFNTRGCLVQIFKRAMGRGLITWNPAAATNKDMPKVQRHRLKYDEFLIIHRYGRPILKNAMHVALYSLQRREDICSFEKSNFAVQHNKKFLQVQQGKTETCLEIEIVPGSPLDTVIRRCWDDDKKLKILSKHLIHYTYVKGPYRKLAGEPVEPDVITDYFAEARALAMEKEGIFEGLTKYQRPTFHEIRALGAKLYAEAGYWPQHLLGHKTEAMTQAYLARHGITYNRVPTPLPLPIHNLT